MCLLLLGTRDIQLNFAVMCLHSGEELLSRNKILTLVLFVCQTARFWYQIKMCKNNNLSFKKIWGIFYCGGQLRSDHGSTIGTRGLLEYSQCIVHRVYFSFCPFSSYVRCVFGRVAVEWRVFLKKNFLETILKMAQDKLIEIFMCPKSSFKLLSLLETTTSPRFSCIIFRATASPN